LFSISTRGDHLFTMARMRERPETAMLADVLIADDNRDTREMYALYLSMLGYHAAIAADGGEAVRVARGHRPDLIVMDLDMPDMDGWAAIRELQSDACTASIPVIGLSSLASPEAIERGRKVGLHDYVAKFDRQGLIAALKEQTADIDCAA